MNIKLSKFWEHIEVPVTRESDDLVCSQYINCLNNRVILLNDNIDDEVIETIVLPLIAMDNDGSNKPITIMVNTCGGCVGSGFSIVHTIEHLKTPTTVYLIGEAFSMGLYIAMAGYNNPNVKTICTPYTRAMYHMGHLNIDEEELEDEKDLLDFQREYDKTVVYDYIISHSKITREMLESWDGREKYFTAKELENLGIAEIER